LNNQHEEQFFEFQDENGPGTGKTNLTAGQYLETIEEIKTSA
jgi:hypothetical protein